MSRHQIPGFDPMHEVVVGWDPPLMTFFVQVFDRSLPEDHQCIHWVGADRPCEIEEIDDLVRAMRSYAIIDPDVRATLYYDKIAGV